MSSSPSPSSPSSFSLLQKLRSAAEKANPARWIDELERCQGLADQMEQLNETNHEDHVHREMRRSAQAACLERIQTHLTEFRSQHPQKTYEEWIAALHPENAKTKQNQKNQQRKINARFYVEQSHHLHLWNAMVPNELKRVPTNMQQRSSSSLEAAVRSSSMHEFIGWILLDGDGGGGVPNASDATSETMMCSPQKIKQQQQQEQQQQH